MKKGPDEMRTRLYRSVNAADLPNIILLFITSCSTLALKTQDFTELKLPVKTMNKCEYFAAKFKHNVT